MQGPHKLRLMFDVEAVEERLRIIGEILDKLRPPEQTGS
jgi:hypothetical protein